jgi:hypothetical protein
MRQSSTGRSVTLASAAASDTRQQKAEGSTGDKTKHPQAEKCAIGTRNCPEPVADRMLCHTLCACRAASSIKFKDHPIFSRHDDLHYKFSPLQE